MWRVAWSARKQHAYLYHTVTKETKWAEKGDATYDALPLKQKSHGAEAACRARHNLWKRSLIESFVKPRATVLDICCGKGGDLLKLMHRNPYRVVAMDISPISLGEAQRRVAECMSRLRVEFIVADLTRPWPAIDITADVALCFFAMHYFCDAEKSTAAFAQQLRACLHEGAHLVTIIPDAEYLDSRLPDYMAVTNLQDGERVLGQSYSFRFGNRVPTTAKEYAMPLPDLTRVLAPWFSLEKAEKHPEDVPETKFYVALIWRAV